MAEDVEAIARGLSESEVFLFRQMKKAFSVHPGHQTNAIRHFLRRAEIELGLLANPSFDNFFLTPLGLAVRAHLIERNGDVG